MNAPTSIAFAPLLPWIVLIPLFLAAAAVAALGLYRRAKGATLRVLAMAAIALTLANPSLVNEQREPVKDVGLVVLDESPSQQIGRRADRAAAALARIEEQLKGFPDLELRVVRTREQAAAGQATEETRLFEAADRALADVPRRRVAGTVLITDGQVHDVPAQANGLSGFGPIHTLLTGEKNERDRRIEIVSAPSFGIVDKTVTLVVRVNDTTGIGQRTANVTFLQDGADKQVIQVPVGTERRVDFRLKHGGPTVFEVEAEAVAGELTLANNRAAVAITGVRDRLRVLLISGEPHVGERTWRNLLKADPGVELIHFTILRPPEKQDGTPIRELSLIAFPIRELFEIKLSEFDLIIFDRYRRRGVLPPVYYGNIANYVAKGGALLEASGPAFATPMSVYRSQLGDILPGEPTGNISVQPFTPTTTEMGRRHPVTANLPGDLPGRPPEWGRWFRQIDVAPRKGSVVMEGGNSKPLLLLDRVGEGRVAQLTSDHIWLWSRGFEGGGPQAELLRRLAHWLMKEPELEENDLRATVEGNRITIERRSLEPGDRTVTITAPSGKTETLNLRDSESGRAAAVTTSQELGVHRISDGTLNAFAVVGSLNAKELTDVRTTDDKLRPAADATGGGVLWLADNEAVNVRRVRTGRDSSGRDWIGFPRTGEHVVTGVSEVPLLPAGLVFLLAVGGLAAAWRREGR